MPEKRAASWKNSGRKHRGLKARRDSLEEVLSHRSYTTESVKRLFKAVEKGQAGDFAPIGVLADFVEVDPGS